jgi:hypothetical protein
MEFAISDSAASIQVSTFKRGPALSLSGLAASRLSITYHLVFSIHWVSATSLLVVTIPISEYYFLQRHAVLLSFSACVFNIKVSSRFHSFCLIQVIPIVCTALFDLHYIDSTLVHHASINGDQ